MSRLRSLVSLDEDPNISLEALQGFIRSLQKSIDENDWHEINLELEDLNPTILNSLVISTYHTMLREHRWRLANWQNFQSRARKTLRQRGQSLRMLRI